MRHVDINEYGLHPQTIQQNGFLNLRSVVPGTYLMIRAAVDNYSNNVAYFSDVIEIDPGSIPAIEEDEDGTISLSYSCDSAIFDSIGTMVVRDGQWLWAGGDGHTPGEDMLVCAMVPLYGWAAAKERFEPALREVTNPEWLEKFRKTFCKKEN